LKKIYFDHNATTPVSEEIFEAMVPYLSDEWGNPSSIHWAGRAPKKAIDEARENVSALLNCTPQEVIFTGSGSEGNNLAIKGTVFSRKAKGNHIITTRVEHPSVMNTLKYLEREGFEVTWLDVDTEGMIDLERLEKSITPKTVLITIMSANNETGVILPVDEIGRIARAHKVLFHTDAVQAAGKVPVNVKDINCDLLTISGHKLYGPKGVGALFVKRGVRVVPLIHGGHHERRRRGGTENVASIVGLGKACEMALRDMDEVSSRIRALRDRLEKGLMEKIPYTARNGHPENRLPNTANLGFEFVEGESLLLNLDMLGIAASSGSACTSGSLEPSHVLIAMGISPELSHGSVRFTLGRVNTDEDVDYLLNKMPLIVERMRSMSPLWSAEEGKRAEISFEEKGH
jgi:cysteine desulfurase